MHPEELKKILAQLQQGKISVEKVYDNLKDLPYKDLGHTKVDNHRHIRTGYPEVIFCQGKTVEQVVHIVQHMMERESNVLGTRATGDMYNAISKIYPEAVYDKMAKTLTILQKEPELAKTYISIVTAGTSDLPVAEEAAITAEFFGNKVERFYDVGVAGIHRLHGNIEKINGARVILVVAGMEGALPSVVGGMVDKPVIAVPTSVGYGASFNGLAALLGMLTSCASGVSVVNIDNGFGAGYQASMINKL